MATYPLRVTFLGTSSGGGPSESRNCSSLILEVLGNGHLWMVDAGEGTLRQFYLQPQDRYQLRPNQLKKIFITHLHADHTMGIIAILRNILFPPLTDDPPSALDMQKEPRIELYGPAGLRTFVRSILQMTQTRTADRYVVHELLTPGSLSTPCEPADVLHWSENAGQDILCSDDGLWRNVTSHPGRSGEAIVDAAPIEHRAPCIGYVFRESSAPQRKIVILGDTSNASKIVPLALSPSLVVHEATDAFIPRSVDPKAKRSPELVLQKALSRGHSTPVMAGEFAKQVGAERLVLNHIGGRFPAPRFPNDRGVRGAVIKEIERQASVAWGKNHTSVAWDFMQVVIPPPANQESINAQPANQHNSHHVSNHHAHHSTRPRDADPPSSGGVHHHEQNKRRK